MPSSKSNRFLEGQFCMIKLRSKHNTIKLQQHTHNSQHCRRPKLKTRLCSADTGWGLSRQAQALAHARWAACLRLPQGPWETQPHGNWQHCSYGLGDHRGPQRADAAHTRRTAQQWRPFKVPEGALRLSQRCCLCSAGLSLPDMQANLRKPAAEIPCNSVFLSSSSF